MESISDPGEGLAAGMRRNGRKLKFAARTPGFRLAGFGKTRMQKPNYQFEKRRKEMDKKAKKAEKLRRKNEAPRPSVAEDNQASPTPVQPT